MSIMQPREGSQSSTKPWETDQFDSEEAGNRWHPLDLKGIYALVTNSFTAAGGDGFVALGQSQNLYPFGPPTDQVRPFRCFSS
jgi:2',3'-cyclic-nucleotide 2'-phosphodiesterase (5'-nucleotidase family)